MDAVKVDAKGRLSIPVEIRKKMDMHPGDVFFLDVKDHILQVAKAENPFDALVEEAFAEDDADETMDIRDFASDEGIDPAVS